MLLNQTPFWVFATEGLPAGFSATAVAQINSMAIITALIGPLFIGWMRDTTGNFTLALVPLLILAVISGTSALLMGRASVRQAKATR